MNTSLTTFSLTYGSTSAALRVIDRDGDAMALSQVPPSQIFLPSSATAHPAADAASDTRKGTHMNYQLTAFDFHTAAIRVIDIDAQPWFPAKDICDKLGIGGAQGVTSIVKHACSAGGRLLSHLSADDHQGAGFIDLLSINKNAAIVCPDRNRLGENSKGCV